MDSASILVVDHDPMLGEQLRALLGVLGHRALCHTSMPKVLRLLRETSFDAVFCDYWIPPHGGQAFYRQLELLRPELTGRLVFMVGGVLSDETQFFMKTKRTPQLVKPFKLNAVQDVIERIFPVEEAAAVEPVTASVGGNEPLQEEREQKEQQGDEAEPQPGLAPQSE